jgi:hypothetical protein
VTQVAVFSYPSGFYNEETIELLKANGIRAAVATQEGFADPNGDRFAMRRIHVGADTGKWEFKARLSGLYYFLVRLAGQADH